MKWFTLPMMVMLGIAPLSVCFAEDYTLPAKVGNVTFVYGITKDISNRSGQVDEEYNMDFLPLESVFYSRFLSGRGQYFSVGPQYYRGSYSDNVDTAKTVTYKGRTYSRVKNITDAEIYVSVIQPITNFATGTENYYTIPYTTHNGVNAAFNYINNCKPVKNNSPMGINCTSSFDGLELEADIDARAGREGDLYIYLPRIPTREVNLGTIPLSSTTISGTGISTEGWEKARSLSERAPQTTLINTSLSGTLRFNNNCRLLNTTGGIAINFQDLAPGAFTGKGKKPNGVTPVKTDIVFNCDKDIGNTYEGMNWSVTATTNSISSEPGILKAAGSEGNTINNLGVKLTKDVSGTLPINIHGQDNPAVISGANATATFYAFPTMLTDNLPSGAGGYIATATVTFNVP